MNEPHDHPAVQILLAFFLAMKGWGDDMIRHYHTLDWGNVRWTPKTGPLGMLN